MHCVVVGWLAACCQAAAPFLYHSCERWRSPRDLAAGVLFLGSSHGRSPPPCRGFCWCICVGAKGAFGAAAVDQLSSQTGPLVPSGPDCLTLPGRLGLLGCRHSNCSSTAGAGGCARPVAPVGLAGGWLCHRRFPHAWPLLPQQGACSCCVMPRDHSGWRRLAALRVEAPPARSCAPDRPPLPLLQSTFSC